MSPSKKRKLENETNSTPHQPFRQRKRGVASISDTYTNSPISKRLARRPISESEYSQVMLNSLYLEINPIMEFFTVYFENKDPNSKGVESKALKISLI